MIDVVTRISANDSAIGTDPFRAGAVGARVGTNKGNLCGRQGTEVKRQKEKIEGMMRLAHPARAAGETPALPGTVTPYSVSGPSAYIFTRTR